MTDPQDVDQQPGEDEASREGAPPDSLAELSSDARRQQLVEQVTQQLMISASWSGRLPNPRDLREYEAIVPGSAREIIDEMLQESKIMQQSVDLDRETSQRMMSIMERQEDRFTEESQSDREVRDTMLNRIAPLLYAPVVLFVLVLFLPAADSVRITALIVLAALYLVPLSMALLRGRVSDNERDAMKIVPEITREVMSALRAHEKQPGHQEKILAPETDREPDGP